MDEKCRRGKVLSSLSVKHLHLVRLPPLCYVNEILHLAREHPAQYASVVFGTRARKERLLQAMIDFFDFAHWTKYQKAVPAGQGGGSAFYESAYIALRSSLSTLSFRLAIKCIEQSKSSIGRIEITLWTWVLGAVPRRSWQTAKTVCEEVTSRHGCQQSRRWNPTSLEFDGLEGGKARSDLEATIKSSPSSANTFVVLKWNMATIKGKISRAECHVYYRDDRGPQCWRSCVLIIQVYRTLITFEWKWEKRSWYIAYLILQKAKRWRFPVSYCL